jgi:hypothetical protein
MRSSHSAIRQSQQREQAGEDAGEGGSVEIDGSGQGQGGLPERANKTGT